MKKKLIRIILLGLLIFIGYQIFTTYQNVKKVLAYRPMVQEVLDENDTKTNENLEIGRAHV